MTLRFGSTIMELNFVFSLTFYDVDWQILTYVAVVLDISYPDQLST